MEKRSKTRLVTNCIIALVYILPLYWTINTSLKSRDEIYSNPYGLFPTTPTLQNYLDMFTLENGMFARYFSNSIITVVLTVMFVVVVSLLAGYGFSKLNIPGKGIFMVLIMAALMIPFHALLNPLYSLMMKLNLFNNRMSLVLIYTTFQMPFCIFMMKNAFDVIPTSLRESAMIDGAGEIRVFWQIMSPLVWTSVATIAIYCAYTTWNDYIVALVFANVEHLKTVNIGMSSLAIGKYGNNWGLLSAGSIISLTPIMLLFIFLQKYFIKGMLNGAVK